MQVKTMYTLGRARLAAVAMAVVTMAVVTMAVVTMGGFAVGGFAVGGFAVGGMSWLAMPECQGQEAAANPGPGGPTIGSPYPGGYKSVKACRLCHRGQIRELDPDQDKSFVLLNEPAIWLTDPHSKAFAFIDWSTAEQTPLPGRQPEPARPLAPSQQLSREICAKLGIADIHTARQCLSCHANWVAGLDQPPPLYAAGVGCESCHGPSAGWENEHKEASWRARPVAYKTSQGMIDVRNPITRAEQCFSCHIGNLEQGKLLTHEMYAAGHPPLPSIEIESFAQQMPRHWRYLEEKIADSHKVAGAANPAANPDKPPFAFFDEFVRENHRGLISHDPTGSPDFAGYHQGAAAVVLGGVLALRESVQLTADLARAATNNRPSWPELSAFDCTACHHDLKKSGSGETGTRTSRPGRPTMHAWPTALVQLAIFHIADGRDAAERRSVYLGKLGEFNQRLAAVQAEFEATPFGNPLKLEKVSSDLSQWLTDELVTPVAEKPFDGGAVQRARKMLLHIGGSEHHDYDSARQIGWALRTLCCDVAQTPAIQALFGELATDLRLDLPNASGDSCGTTAKTGELRNAPIPLTDSVPAALAAEVRYDPERFRETMKKLQQLVE